MAGILLRAPGEAGLGTTIPDMNKFQEPRSRVPRYSIDAQVRKAVIATGVALVGFAGCGTGDDGGGHSVEKTPPPTIKSAKLAGRHVQVAYRVAGADGGSWPRMLLSVEEPRTGLPPRTETVYPLDAEGRVTLPFEVDASQRAVVLASVVYSDGSRSAVVRHGLDH